MIKEKFLQTIREHQMLKRGERVLVAVSGGVDSTALLHLLADCASELKISLQVAHLNHLIRKGEAELDVKYVERISQNLGLPLTVEAIDVAAWAREQKKGLEESARILRYEFLERVAQKIGAHKIAVGHTADDNIETFLMRLVRGAGGLGLCGIPPRRDKIIRPLIKIWRRRIEDYVGELKLVPRRDHTNYETRYLRNLVRLKLIPQLKTYNRNIKEILLNTTFLLTQDYLFLEEKSEEALEQVARDGKLSIEKLKKVEPALRGHLLRKAIEKVKGSLSNLDFSHIQEILSKVGAAEKWELHLPDGVYALGNQRTLIFTLEKPKADKQPFAYRLPVPGEADVPELGIKIKAEVLDKPKKLETSSNVALLDFKTTEEELSVRSWQAGDRFSPLGMKGKKKLQDFFVDEKVPEEERGCIPIVESKKGIVWVAGYRVDERAKVSEKTKQAVRLEVFKNAA